MSGEEGKLDVGGADIYYEVAGEGHTLVLLHDGLLDRRAWDASFEAFSRLYRTVRYDRRGYGASSTPRRPFSDVSDLRLLLQHLGVDEVCPVGASGGGKVALEFTLEHPEMVRSMVLVGPGLDGYEPSEEKKRRVAAIMETARERGVEAGVEAWMEDPFYPPRNSAGAREQVRRLARENLPRLLSTPSLRKGPSSPVIEEIPRIVAPTLILVGERDDGDNMAIASVLEDGLPHGTKRVVGGSGHLVHLEVPEAFERLVFGWLRGAGAGPDRPSG